MAKTKKTLKYGALVILIAVLTAAALYFNSLLPIITGYAAKNLCSAVFISERQPSDVEELDLNFSFIKLNKNSVDYEQKSVTSRFLWGKSKAIYREGFGVTLIRDISEAELRSIKFPEGTEPSYSQDTIKWPLGNILPDTATGIDLRKLKEISRKVIDDNAYNGHIFAFMVVHKGIPVEESYKPGFNSSTKFISWSMAKSFTNAIVGIMSLKGMLDVNQPAGFEEWKDDDRSKITLNDLLQMQSGLEWNENYGAKSDVTVMLHCVGDMGGFAWGNLLNFRRAQTGSIHQAQPILFVILFKVSSKAMPIITLLSIPSFLTGQACLTLLWRLTLPAVLSGHHTFMPQPATMHVSDCFT
jgi:hypothetical protein